MTEKSQLPIAAQIAALATQLARDESISYTDRGITLTLLVDHLQCELGQIFKGLMAEQIAAADRPQKD